MLTKKIFQEQIDRLQFVFPEWKVDFNELEAQRAWYSFFSTCEDRPFIRMIDNYIENERFNPTVAGLKKYYKNNEIYYPTLNKKLLD